MHTLLGRSFRFDGITFDVVGINPAKGLRLWNANRGAEWCSVTMWTAMQMAGLEAA